MTYYTVDFAAGTVEEKTGPEDGLRSLQQRLRALAVKIDEAPDGPEKAELRKKYRALQEKLRELGGDAPVRENYPGDELTAAVDGIVADFTGAGEVPAPEPSSVDGGTHAGLEEFMDRIAENDSGELPEHVRQDAELQEALRSQAHEDHFGEDAADNLSDDEMWGQYRETLGMEEG